MRVMLECIGEGEVWLRSGGNKRSWRELVCRPCRWYLVTDYGGEILKGVGSGGVREKIRMQGGGGGVGLARGAALTSGGVLDL